MIRETLKIHISRKCHAAAELIYVTVIIAVTVIIILIIILIIM